MIPRDFYSGLQVPPPPHSQQRQADLNLLADTSAKRPRHLPIRIPIATAFDGDWHWHRHWHGVMRVQQPFDLGPDLFSGMKFMRHAQA